MPRASSSFFLVVLVAGDLGSVAVDIMDVSPGAWADVGDVGAAPVEDAALLRGMLFVVRDECSCRLEDLQTETCACRCSIQYTEQVKVRESPNSRQWDHERKCSRTLDGLWEPCALQGADEPIEVMKNWEQCQSVLESNLIVCAIRKVKDENLQWRLGGFDI